MLTMNDNTSVILYQISNELQDVTTSTQDSDILPNEIGQRTEYMSHAKHSKLTFISQRVVEKSRLGCDLKRLIIGNYQTMY